MREAATGEQALGFVATETPDLVLLDVNLPDLNGFEVCRRIKADPATARIPVVHVSASSVRDADKVQGLEGGADSYLTEPVEAEVLVATINAALRTRRAEDAARALASQWQRTFDAIRDGVALLDPEGRLLRWNRGMECLLGMTAAELSDISLLPAVADGRRAGRAFRIPAPDGDRGGARRWMCAADSGGST